MKASDYSRAAEWRDSISCYVNTDACRVHTACVYWNMSGLHHTVGRLVLVLSSLVQCSVVSATLVVSVGAVLGTREYQ